MNQDLLFELGVEELPASSVSTIADRFADYLTRLLKQHNLTFQVIESFATPRRIALVVKSLSAHQPDSTQQKIGPWKQQAYAEDGSPTQALQGFMRSTGVSADKLEHREQNGKIRLVATFHIPGQPTVQLLPNIFTRLIEGVTLQTSMCWGDGSRSFVRPVRWVTLLYGEQVIDCTLFGIAASNTSYGHRFAAPDKFTVTPAEYVACLRKVFVIASVVERRRIIADQIALIADKYGGKPLAPSSLIDELCGLVEYPRILVGSIDTCYLQLPKEILLTTLEKHQRYIALESPGGALMTTFLFVTNMPAIKTTDDAAIVKGNERVLKPRLEDASFFWKKDCETGLAAYAAQLEQVVFETRLGSMADKSARLHKLVGTFADSYQQADKQLLEQAARLCKADLVSTLVNEFPELQGIIGGHLAKHDRLQVAIAEVISQHYMPYNAGDTLPDTPEARLLALADKLDHLCGLFVAGKQGTADADPFGARRACLGVLQLSLALPGLAGFRELLRMGLHLFEADSPALRQQLTVFFEDRMVNWYQRQSMPVPVVRAVLATGLDSITEIDSRVQFLAAATVTTENIAKLIKRVRNILNDFQEAGETDAKLLTHAKEQELYQRYTEVKPVALGYLQSGEYLKYLNACNSLIKPLSELFDEVMIKSGEKSIQRNRFRLIDNVRKLCCALADVTSL